MRFDVEHDSQSVLVRPLSPSSLALSANSGHVLRSARDNEHEFGHFSCRSYPCAVDALRSLNECHCRSLRWANCCPRKSMGQLAVWPPTACTRQGRSHLMRHALRRPHSSPTPAPPPCAPSCPWPRPPQSATSAEPASTVSCAPRHGPRWPDIYITNLSFASSDHPITPSLLDFHVFQPTVVLSCVTSLPQPLCQPNLTWELRSLRLLEPFLLHRLLRLTLVSCVQMGDECVLRSTDVVGRVVKWEQP